MELTDEPLYIVREDLERFRVIGPDGREILACRDAPSAAHYATLLEQSYRAGFRAGRKASR